MTSRSSCGLVQSRVCAGVLTGLLLEKIRTRMLSGTPSGRPPGDRLPAMSDPHPPAGMSRRNFLAVAAGITAAAAVPTGRRRLLQANGYPIDAETPLDQLTTYVTPNDLFFVRSHWNPTMPDRAAWALAVDGEVERPLR